jgi:hypothetical protein
MCRALRDESGQALFFLAVSMVVVIAIAALSIEGAHGYFAYHALQASTNAAALAGAAGLPNTTVASSNVTAYSSVTGNKNASPMLQSVVATPNFLCLSTVTNSFKTPCMTASGATGGYNAVSVTQTAKVPLWFGRILGVSTLNLSATATAAMRGGNNTPWNIAIILDTTNSMSKSDSTGQCSGTRISCALLGVQALLGDLYPCAIGITCTSSTAPVDSVSLFVFPAVLNTTAPNVYGNGKCPSSAPTIQPYTLPTLPSSPAASAVTYQVVPFSNDYRSTDAATTLSKTSDIVIATGGAGCSGITAPGGEGTYYAQVINAAQAALVAQQTANPGSRNAMIILSDGDAESSVSYSSTGSGSKKVTTISSTSQLQPTSGISTNLNGTTINNPTSYTYPSAVGECGQGVYQAQLAITAGTAVYTIGYGSQTSGCTTDAQYSGTYTNGGGSWQAGYSPCRALAAMASSVANVYSDDANGCVAPAPTNAAITALTTIFHQIAGGLTTPRLIPNGTT